MIRKRYGEASGNWHIDVFINGEWVEISEPGNEVEADGIIEVLAAWLTESILEASKLF